MNTIAFLKQSRPAWIPAICLLTVLAAPAQAAVDVVPNGPCGFTLRFNLQFFGVADSAFAEGAKQDILDCWDVGLEFECCPIDVEVLYLIGGAQTAGYDSIHVVDTPGFVSNCYLGEINGGDGVGTWSTDDLAINNAFAHEVGHLCGLDDQYEVKDGKIKNEDNRVVDCRTTGPKKGFDGDKMAQLDGTVSAYMVATIADKAGINCSISCWPSDIPGADMSGGVNSTTVPVIRPGEGPGTLRIELQPFTFFAFWQAQDDGGGFGFAEAQGYLEFELDPPASPNLNPTGDFTEAPMEATDMTFFIGNFETAPGESTGVNMMTLAPELELLDPAYAPRGFIGDNPGGSAPGVSGVAALADGSFHGVMPVKLVNDVFPPTAPAFMIVPYFGQVDYDTGSGFFGWSTQPFLFPSLASVPPGRDRQSILSLAQNMPNPALNSTRIAFRLEAAGRASLRIHDVSGRLVRTLLENDIAAGTYSIQWDGRSDRGDQAPSGVYFYTLQAGPERQTRRLTLLR